MLDENARLLSQRGMFTRTHPEVDIESWVRNAFPGEEETWVLIKIVLPNEDRVRALRMNINYLTLFPDLLGAALHTNLSAVIPHY